MSSPRGRSGSDGAAQREDSSFGSVSQLPVDSPISAADMLTRSLQRRRRQRMTLGTEPDRSARSTAAEEPRSSPPPPLDTNRLSPARRRLFPDATVNDGSTSLSPPTARHHPSSRRSTNHRARPSEQPVSPARRSDGRQSTVFRPPISSTPFRSTKGQPLKRTAGSAFATPMAHAEQAASGLFSSGTRAALLKRRKTDDASVQGGNSGSSSGGGAAERGRKQGLFARWGGGVEESPMDMLRRLAAAPGFAATHTPSDQGHGADAGSSVSGQASVQQGRRRISTDPRPSVGAGTSAAGSDLGVGRRQSYMPERGLFGSLLGGAGAGDDSSAGLSSILAGKPTLAGRPSIGRFGEASSIQPAIVEEEEDEVRNNEQEERDLEQILADDVTRREGFALGNETGESTAHFAYDRVQRPVARDMNDDGAAQGRNIFLADEEEEADATDAESFQSAQEVVEAEERTPWTGRESSEEVRFDDDADSLVREEKGHEVGQPIFDDTAATATEDGVSIDDSLSELDVDAEIRRRERIARRKLLMNRVKQRRSDRTSTLTKKPVDSLPSRMVEDVFKTMITPSVGIGAAMGTKNKATVLAPGKRRRQERVAMDAMALEAVDEMTHHFFTQLAERATKHVSKRRKRRHSHRDDAVKEVDVLAVLRADGTVHERMSLMSLARKMLPREWTDSLTPDMEQKLKPKDLEDGSEASRTITMVPTDEPSRKIGKKGKKSVQDKGKGKGKASLSKAAAVAPLVKAKPKRWSSKSAFVAPNTDDDEDSDDLYSSLRPLDKERAPSKKELKATHRRLQEQARRWGIAVPTFGDKGELERAVVGFASDIESS